MQGRSAENTNKATKLWVDVLQEYLVEKNMCPLVEILDTHLPNVLSDFCTEIHKKDKPAGKKKAKTG